jgi:hypothetical protein
MMEPVQPAAPDRDRQWLLALLPAFPLVLLVLRLWYLSRQDLPTMLLLVQYVSPLGLVSALLITLVWVLPVVILTGRALGRLLLVSTPDGPDRAPSWLVRASQRVPGWVVLLAVLLALLTWQMQYLPALLMIAVSILGLTARLHYRDRPRLVRAVCVLLPLAAAAAAYGWLGAAIVAAFREMELVTAFLLLLPPALTPLLTGPVPARLARLVTHWPATAAALLGPFLIGAIFLQAPILPTVAVEVDADGPAGASAQIVRGHVIAVDDQAMTLLDAAGSVRFLRNEQVLAKTLCPEPDVAPSSMVEVHGWPVEETALEWIAPARHHAPLDPRCLGRPLPS